MKIAMLITGIILVVCSVFWKDEPNGAEELVPTKDICNPYDFWRPSLPEEGIYHQNFNLRFADESFHIDPEFIFGENTDHL